MFDLDKEIEAARQNRVWNRFMVIGFFVSFTLYLIISNI